MKAISFSLYGNAPRYYVGAIKNAILASRYFPFDDGFVVKFFVGKSVEPWVISTLKRIKGVQIELMEEPEDNTAKLWRYFAFSDPQFDAVICRDTDARLSYRDRMAHSDWLLSGREFHIIKDHPIGHDYPISAGMFAGKTRELRWLKEKIENTTHEDHYTTDQDFLGSQLYPMVFDDCLVHDSYYNTAVEGQSIRTEIPFDAPTPLSHIGAALEADDRFVFEVDRKAQYAYCGSDKYQYEHDRWGK